MQDRIFRDTWPAALASRVWAPTLRVWREQIELEKPLGSARRLRLAFASDFHAGPLTPPALLLNACEELRAGQAGIILLGGDFISLAARHASRLLAPLQSLTAPLGVFAVLGNHDHWAGAAAVAAMLDQAGITLLTNRSHRLPSPFENTIVVGLDDHISGNPDHTGPSWDAGAATLLLIHQPSGLLDLGGHAFDVAFAGHTHGGQITLGRRFAPVVPQGAYSRRYLAGRFRPEEGHHLLVSVGIGNSGLPIRLGPVPEILVCDLIAPG